MGKLLIQDKEIVVPGEIIAEGMDHLPGQGTYREGDKIIAGRLGLANVEGRAVKLIALSGRYIPKRNDTIICQVIDVGFSGWRVETNSAYSAMLSVKDATSEFIRRGADITHYFNVGDYLVAKITNVTSQKLIDISTKGPGLRKLHGGRIIQVNCNKVPRIIGKAGSMVSMIKNATGCRITVGQNGLVWLEGEPKSEYIAIEAIRKIEQEAHLSGLTDRVKAFLEEKTGKKVEPGVEEPELR
ncbi:RNA-binding protein [Candidatus Woesearchaeota archaeon]|nr:RNA-binding protein [Candidatus Woesearchaeota archaeon]